MLNRILLVRVVVIIKLLEFQDDRTIVRIPRNVTFRIPKLLPCKDKRPLLLIGLLLFSMFSPVFATAWDITTMEDNDITFDFSSEVDDPGDIYFSNNGSLMYIIDYGQNDNRIFQYWLSTAWDVTSASVLSGVCDTTAQDDYMAGLTLSEDGSKLYTVGWTSDDVFQYSLSTPFDVSTCSYDNVNLALWAGVNYANKVYFNNNGSVMIVADDASDKVGQYVLSTPWDLSSASDDGQWSFSEEASLYGVYAQKVEGVKGYTLGATGGNFYQYSLSTAWDWMTASYDSEYYSYAGDCSLSRGFDFSRDGTKAYLLCDDDNNIYVYDMPDYSINLYGKYNASLITDNSTSHFFAWNTSQVLNFNSFNSSGSSLSGLQILNYSIPDLSLYAQNITSGTDFNVTFNNWSVWNYTVIVQDFYNSSTNLTSYFYSANLHNLNVNYSVNVLTNTSNEIVFDYNSSQTGSLTLYDFIIFNNVNYAGKSQDVYYTFSGVSENVTSTVGVNVTLSGQTLYLNQTFNQTYWNPFLDNCSSYNTYALNITFRDELTREILNITNNGIGNYTGGNNGEIDIEVSLDYGNPLTYHFYWVNTSSYSICISPSWASYDFSADIGYNALGYYGRNYYYYNASLSNSTDILNLYSLDHDTGNRMDFKLQDQFNLPLEDYYIVIKRWYADIDDYIITDMVRTNYLGEASSYIHYSTYENVYYEIDVWDDERSEAYVVDRDNYYDPVKTMTITLTTTETNFFTVMDRFSLTSNIDDVKNGTTSVLVAVISDLSGETLIGGLNVSRTLNGNFIGVACNDSSETPSSSITVYCDLGNTTGNVYYAMFWARDPNNLNSLVIIDDDWISFAELNDFSNNAIVGAVILVGFLQFAGLMIGGIIISALVFILSIFIISWLGIFFINPMAFYLLFGLSAVVFALSLWRRE